MYNPAVLNSIRKHQELFHEGVSVAETKYKSIAFEGKLMSDIVGSPPAVVSQILENLNADIGYKKYDGRKIFEFLYGEADFDATRVEFEKLALHQAVEELQGYTEVVKVLLNAKAGVDLKDKDGQTLLSWSAINGYAEVAQ